VRATPERALPTRRRSTPVEARISREQTDERASLPPANTGQGTARAEPRLRLHAWVEHHDRNPLRDDYGGGERADCHGSEREQRSRCFTGVTLTRAGGSLTSVTQRHQSSGHRNENAEQRNEVHRPS